jgi:WD40 repeat protein
LLHEYKQNFEGKKYCYIIEALSVCTCKFNFIPYLVYLYSVSICLSQVNDIAFHPVHGTLATVGSDGSFSFWDKDARTKLKPSEAMEQPITRCCFNNNGQIFAYAVSYDWSKVGHL